MKFEGKYYIYIYKSIYAERRRQMAERGGRGKQSKLCRH